MSIAVTGNPGVGKHTISRQIAEKLCIPIIDINQVSRENGLFEKNEDVYDVDTEELRKIIRDEISRRRSIITGHLAPYILNKEQIDVMIVLRRSPYELLKVYQDRKYPHEKSRENIESEILGIIAHDAMDLFQNKVFQIDSSQKRIDEVVGEVMKTIARKENDEKEIDWLGLIARNDDVKKFLQTE